MTVSNKDVFRVCINSPGIKPGEWSLPSLFWGEPGAGKTAMLRHESRLMGLQCFVLSPGEMGEGAFGVVPVPLSAGPGLPVRITYPAPEWVDQIGDEAVLFVDELSSAPPQLHPPLLGLLLEKRIGGVKLAPGIRIVGAANPPAIAANGFDLAPPVANRMGHFEWTLQDADEWGAYMLRKNWHDTSVPDAVDMTAIRNANKARVLAHYDTAYAKAAALVGAFLHRKPDLKNKMPAEGASGMASWAYPTDRSWDMATCAIAGAEANGASLEVSDHLIAGFVGAGAAKELAAFRHESDLPDPVAILDGKLPFKHTQNRMDRTYATLGACAAIVGKDNDKKRQADRAKLLWGILGTLADSNGDLALRPAKMLVEAQLPNMDVGKKLTDLVAATK